LSQAEEGRHRLLDVPQVMREIPNDKSQLPNKLQTPNLKFQTIWNLEFGIYLELGAWDLVLFFP
jgi:hypothetical protein